MSEETIIRTAVVTGGSRGIGRAVCIQLAKQGCNVVVNYCHGEAAAAETVALCKAENANAVAVQADVSTAEGCKALFEQAVNAFGRVDILVNNAGITRDNLILRMSEEDFDAVLNANLKGAFLCCKEAARRMVRQRWGRIVNLSSVVALRGNAGQTNYAASKAGLIGLTKSLARELASRNVTVNAVAPGFIETDMTAALPEAVRICNASLIAAITIAVKPGKVDPKSLRTPVLFFFVAAAFYAGVAYTTGYFSRPVGLILLAMFAAYIICNVMAMKNTPAPEEEEEPEENASFAKELGLLAVGAVLIAVGANLLVDNGTLIAQALGVPESVIALTFVALGTSLPELVTAITSLAKGHGALSLGNVIGANVFNLVLVSGVSATVAPFSIPQNSLLFGHNASLVLEFPVMFAVMLLLTLPALFKGKLSRPQGIALLCIYAAFCVVQFTI